jgi:hypothetical protein
MGSDPNAQQNAEEEKLNAAAHDRAINEAAGYVRDTIKFFSDVERKRVLDIALAELDSGLAVIGSGL